MAMDDAETVSAGIAGAEYDRLRSEMSTCLSSTDKALSAAASPGCSGDAGNAVDALLLMLRTSLTLYNSSGCSIKNGNSGQDEEGPWCTFELCFTDRVNLLFCVHAFAMTQANTIKDLWVIQHPKPHILIRPFTKNDRRIISSWEIVPMLPRKGQFTMLRHKRVLS